MSTAELLEHLREMTNAERLEVIEAATRLIRQDLAANSMPAETEQDRRIRAAAASVKHLYEPGGELSEWTALDAEEFVDDHITG